LAEVYELRGQRDQGLDVLEQALTLVEQGGVCWWQAELYRLKGELLRGINDERPKMEENKQWTTNRDRNASRIPHHANTISEAEECFHKALTLAHRQQAKSLELRATMSLSRLWQQQGKRKAAYQLLAAIYEWFTEGLDTADLQEAKVLLEVLSSA
jgi:tetratricopeptide (TPR) repeat protein